MDYATLTSSDQLALARDTLRAKESDHFRLSLVDQPNLGNNIELLEEQIEALKKTVAELESSEEAPKTKPRTRRKPAAKKDE